MTKLMQWLLAIGAVMSVWFALVTDKIQTDFTKQNMNLIMLSPFIFLVIFGVSNDTTG